MLNAVRRGRGEPLVLLHGIGSHWQMWSPVLDRLARERDVLALDLPEFGRSAALGGAPTIAALADAVDAFARGWGTRDALLVPRQGRRARQRMPGARHVWLRGCGHVPTWDDPAQVAAVLLAGSSAA